MQAAMLYLTARHDELRARAAKGDKKRGPYSVITAHIRLHGQPDDKGSRTWDFDAPVEIGGEKYAGMRLQASRPQPYVDPDKGIALITRLGPEAVAAATRTETVWDFEQLFLFRQQGLITRQQLEDVLVTPDAEYSLVAVKAA